MDLLFQILLFVFCANQNHKRKHQEKYIDLFLGIIMLVLALILDYLVINTIEGFSLVQIGGVALGLILILFGLVKMMKKTKKEA